MWLVARSLKNGPVCCNVAKILNITNLQVIAREVGVSIRKEKEGCCLGVLRKYGKIVTKILLLKTEILPKDSNGRTVSMLFKVICRINVVYIAVPSEVLIILITLEN